MPEIAHRYTPHGWPCCCLAPIGSQPASVASCGGPGLCDECSVYAAQAHRPGLYPTKTRIALLRAIAAGLVATDPDGTIRRAHTADWSQWTRVTAAVRELASAGWCRLGTDGVWHVTDSGRDVAAGLTPPQRKVTDGDQTTRIFGP